MNEKSEEYYKSTRADIQQLIQKNVRRVLDVGCGAGMLGHALKSKGVQEVIGIELDEKAAKVASKHLDKVIIGDVENLELPFENGYFDCIIYADILEHLKDPWSILKQHKKFLAPNGSVIASIPNVRHCSTFLNLIKGEWPYASRGIFDSAHLRFFTLKSILRMFDEAGYTLDSVKRNYRLFENRTKYGSVGGGLSKIASKLLPFCPFREFFVFQYVVIARRTNK